MVRGGTTYRIVSDERGSPRLIVNSQTGEIAQELDYDAYGCIVRDTNPSFQPFGFAGGLYDTETGLTHFSARDYDAETGRFTSQDPLDFSSGDTNLYSYGSGDPVNSVDPMGLLGWNTVSDAFSSVADAAGSATNWALLHGPSIPQPVVDFVAGNGDALTFNATRWIRGNWGGNDAVCFGSGSYQAGRYVGYAEAAALGSGATLKYVVKPGQRWLVPWAEREGLGKKLFGLNPRGSWNTGRLRLGLSPHEGNMEFSLRYGPNFHFDIP
jgi:RHS repeat-associated protein